MNDFQLYYKLGLNHIMSWSSVDHILFLAALILVFKLSDWKKLLYLTSLFTIAHTFSLLLSVYGIVKIENSLVENLILWSIIITAGSNLFIKNRIHQVHYFFSFFFGLIHGLGFASDFKMFVDGEEDKLIPSLEFALGIETAQIILGLILLLVISQLISLLKNNDKLLVTSISSFIIAYAFFLMMQ